MPSFSFKLALIMLAVLALRIEAQTTRLTGLRPSRGLDKHGLHNRMQEFVMSSGKHCGKSCGVRRGSSPYDKPDKFLEHSTTDSNETALNATREDRFEARDLFRKPRKRRWISKRKLKKQLQECETRLQETQDALDVPRRLFVQMAQHCTLERAAGRYYLRTTDMDADTYVFTEMPLQQANVWPTSIFVGYLFNELFPVEKPNAAFTFNVYNNQSEQTFEGPLISVLLSSHQFILQDDNSTLVVYELGQSSDQEATSPLSRFFRGSDSLGNASVTYEHCSLFIDSASGDNGSSYGAAPASLDDTVDALNRAAQTVENGPDQTTPVMQTYTKVWSFEQKPLTPKDVYKGAGDSMKAIASLIKDCNGKDCSKNDIVEGVSNLLLTAAYTIGAAFPVADAVFTVVASIGLLFSSLFFDPVSSQAGQITPEEIEAAVRKGLAQYDAARDKEDLDQFSTFLNIDNANMVQFASTLASIRDQKKYGFQATIDNLVDTWVKTTYNDAWTGYEQDLKPVDRNYDRWFGTVDDESNLREDVVHWINDNANECRVTKKPDGMPEGVNLNQYPPPVYDSNDVKAFQQNCIKNVGQGQDKWNRLVEFGQAYQHMAAVLMMFCSQAHVIMQMASNCDPAKVDPDPNKPCLYNSTMIDLTSKVFTAQKRALFLHQVLKEINNECFQARGWPFSQTCNPSSCNYKWSVSLQEFTYRYDPFLDNLRSIGFVLLENSESKNVFDTCEWWRKGFEKDGFAYGGFWVYGLPTTDLTIGYLTHLYFDCGHLSVDLNGDYGFAFGAVPNYALKPDLPKCAALVDDPSLWNPEYSSDSPLKRFTPNLSCSLENAIQAAVEIGAKGDDLINGCWGSCYNILEMSSNPNPNQPFFFSVEDPPKCTCFPKCDIIYQKGSSLFAATVKPGKQ